MSNICNICVNNYDNSNKFHCFGCNFDCCVTCMKSYLLTKTSEPHCMDCRASIPYDQYLSTFDKKWRLSTYKKHRENILWEKEQSLMPITVQKIAKAKEIHYLDNERHRLYNQIMEIEEKISDLQQFIANNNVTSIKDKFKYTHKCIKKECNGYLNEKFTCDLCDINVCKKCFVEKEKDHECNLELVETCRLIKSQAKPCPKCAEFISKIDGCDQMFCTMCGTAFSWTTGDIERGVIHNPHAHSFFRNNPDALNEYMNNRGGGGGNAAGGCRESVPHYYVFQEEMHNCLPDINHRRMFDGIHRSLAEFRQYKRREILYFINNLNDSNEDIRYRFLRNEVDEKAMKSLLHSRNKKSSLKKSVYEIILSTTEIMENYMWTLVDIAKNKEKTTNNRRKQLFNVYDILVKLKDDTNKVIENIYLEHNYKPHIIFENNFKICSI